MILQTVTKRCIHISAGDHAHGTEQFNEKSFYIQEKFFDRLRFFY